jgi:hypothetical protein
MKATIYKLMYMHDGQEKCRLTLSDELPDDVGNYTMTGEQIGNLTTYLGVTRFGTLVVNDKPGQTVCVDGEFVVFRQGSEAWQYTLADLQRELGARWHGTALFCD